MNEKKILKKIEKINHKINRINGEYFEREELFKQRDKLNEELIK